MKTEKVSIKRNKRNYVVIALIIILVLLGVGYASFSQTLTISGTANGTMEWNVKFLTTTSGKIEDDGHKLTVTTDLEYPGDQEAITVTIGNNSSVGIKLKSLNVTGDVDSEDIEILKPELDEDNEKIKAGEKCTYTYVVKWKDNSNQTNVNATYQFSFDYEQDTETENLTPTHGAHTSIN